MRRARLWALWVVASVLSSACPTTDDDAEPLTEVLVQIYADEQVQRAGDSLVVEFKSGERSASELTASDPETFDLSADDFRWPVSMALVAKKSHESYLFELNLRLEKKGEVLARGRVQSAFVKGQIVVLQTSLSAECLGKLDCPENETCVVTNGRASCQSAEVDSGNLPGVKDAPKSNDAGTAPLDAGPSKTSDAGNTMKDAGNTLPEAGVQPVDAATGDASTHDAGSCIPSAEDCSNGIDDDCNGHVDCADSACKEINQCVPNAVVFALVEDGVACPEGYNFFDFVFQELQDPGCGGCGCRPVEKECYAYVAIYDDATVCSRDASPFSGGQELKDPAATTCSTPVGKQIDIVSNIDGFRVHVKESDDACTVSGQAMPQPPNWNVKRKRCSRQLRRDGCQIGAFCAPIQNVPQLCWLPQLGGCANPELARTYFQAFEDRRSCTPCGCTAKNGTCKDVGATLVSDTTCNLGLNTPVKYDGEKYCGTFSPEASARMVGKPRDPFCTTQTTQEGTLSPKAPINMCCGGP